MHDHQPTITPAVDVDQGGGQRHHRSDGDGDGLDPVRLRVRPPITGVTGDVNHHRCRGARRRPTPSPKPTAPTGYTTVRLGLRRGGGRRTAPSRSDSIRPSPARSPTPRCHPRSRSSRRSRTPRAARPCRPTGCCQPRERPRSRAEWASWPVTQAVVPVGEYTLAEAGGPLGARGVPVVVHGHDGVGPGGRDRHPGSSATLRPARSPTPTSGRRSRW